MRKGLGIAVVLAAATLSGCVSTNSVMLGRAKPGEPIDPSAVAIYRSAAQAPAGYREIALIHAAADSGFTDERRMYLSMRREAARLGANALILDGLNDYGAERLGRAVAIVVEGGQTPASP
jgi:hypothetical protein